MHTADPANIQAPDPEPRLQTSIDYDVEAAATATRSFVRDWLLYRICSFLFLFLMTALFAIVTLFEMFDGQNEGAIFLGILVIGGLLPNLWANGHDLGANISLIFAKSDVLVPSPIYGYSSGPVSYALTPDSLGWSFENHAFKFHLSTLDRVTRKGRTLLFRMNLVDRHVMVIPEGAAMWCNRFRAFRRQVDDKGWGLPLHWSEFEYPMETYIARKQGTPREESKQGLSALLVLIFAVCVTFFSMWKAALPFEPRNMLVASLISIPLLYLAYVQIEELIHTIKRKRAGLAPYTRCKHGVTHGQTAYLFSPDRLEIARSHLTHSIQAKCISGATEDTDWIDLLIAGEVIETLPATDEVRDWLEAFGLRPETGPWKRTDGAIDWKRTAPC